MVSLRAQQYIDPDELIYCMCHIAELIKTPPLLLRRLHEKNKPLSVWTVDLQACLYLNVYNEKANKRL